eukprot:48233-Rhodomonas_salina.1
MKRKREGGRGRAELELEEEREKEREKEREREREREREHTVDADHAWNATNGPSPPSSPYSARSSALYFMIFCITPGCFPAAATLSTSDTRLPSPDSRLESAEDAPIRPTDTRSVQSPPMRCPLSRSWRCFTKLTRSKDFSVRGVPRTVVIGLDWGRAACAHRGHALSHACASSTLDPIAYSLQLVTCGQ